MVGFYEYWTRVRSCGFVLWSVATKKLSTNLREVLQCPEKAPTRGFSLLEGRNSTFTIKHLWPIA